MQRKSSLVSVAIVLTVCSFFALLLQFFRIQVLECERWGQRARSQHYFVVKEPFQRGTFYGNSAIQKGVLSQQVAFAFDVALYHVYADPKAIPAKLRTQIQEQVVRTFTPSLPEAKKVGAELSRRCRSRRLVSWVSEEQKRLFIQWWRPFARRHSIASNAIYFVQDFKRVHPMGHLLGQVLHTIQERRDEITGHASPTGGLELSLNRHLEGSVGFRRLMRSPYNSLETGEVISEPVHGANVELTIHPTLQAIVEEELDKGVRQFRAKSGVAIVVEPKSGHILALAQTPFFSPDKYREYFNKPELTDRSRLYALTDAWEPGSPMKAMTMALALKANRERLSKGKDPIFSVHEKIPTRSGAFPGRSQPIRDVVSHDFLNMYMAAQKSSNIYMARLADRMVGAMGAAWYREQLISTFGFGRKTGIELVGESGGVLPVPGKLSSGWSKATPYSLAIGYNLQVTSLQMARAFCVLASGGLLPELTLVRKVCKEGEVLVDHSASCGVRVMEKEDVDEVVKALKFVTQKGGTGAKADIFGYSEAGKSGTTMKLVDGKYSSQAHFASFVGFAPADKAEVVIYVSLDSPWVGHIKGRGFNHRGGTCAGPLFREIGRRTLEFLGVPYDDPYGFASHDPRADPAKAKWRKEAKALAEQYSAWNNR